MSTSQLKSWVLLTVYLCIWGEAILFYFLSIYGSWTLESMEFSNSVKFKPTDPKQCADSHSSHLSCHHSYCAWPWGLLRGCNVTIPGKVHGQCVTYCSHCSLYLRLEVPSPGKLLLTYEVGIRSPCLWYHSTLAFYPSPASLLPGNFSITPKCSQELQDGKSGNTWILLLLLYHPAWSHCQIQHCCSLTQLCLTLCDPTYYST